LTTLHDLDEIYGWAEIYMIVNDGTATT